MSKSTQVLTRPAAGAPSPASTSIAALKEIARNPADANIGGPSTQPGRERTVSLG